MKRPAEAPEAKSPAPAPKPFDIFEGLADKPFTAGQSNSPAPSKPFDLFEGAATAPAKAARSSDGTSRKTASLVVIAFSALIVGVLVGMYLAR